MVHLPKEVVVIHLEGQLKEESKGSNVADCVAKQAAQNKQIVSLIPALTPIKSIDSSLFRPGNSHSPSHRNKDILKMHRTGLLIMKEKSLYSKINNGS